MAKCELSARTVTSHVRLRPDPTTLNVTAVADPHACTTWKDFPERHHAIRSGIEVHAMREAAAKLARPTADNGYDRHDAGSIDHRPGLITTPNDKRGRDQQHENDDGNSRNAYGGGPNGVLLSVAATRYHYVSAYCPAAHPQLPLTVA
jgi:hypothetical protein